MKPECFLRGKSENYRFFFGFFDRWGDNRFISQSDHVLHDIIGHLGSVALLLFFGLIKGGLACCNITIAGLTKSVVKQHTLNIYYSPA